MQKVYEYSHLGGSEILRERYPEIDREIDEIISAVKPPGKTKISEEKPRKGMALYDPKLLNRLFKEEFRKRGWKELKLFYDIEIEGLEPIKRAYKQVDFSKGRVLAEVQFGKYAFMLYDLSKFQYFYLEGKADVGVEIVPCNRLKREMSTGVSYGEMLISNLKRLRKAFPSVPVKIILIDVERPEERLL
ncbi:BstYI [Archaeoglobales archaeon]|nr:MAG: BstYI [Archaeoglobales archaeon]HDN74307.1 BstYI [Archaeoglobus sp.]